MPNITLRELVRRAYGLTDHQIAGPDWLESEHYSIAVKLPENTGQPEMPEMLRALLADRFHFEAHHEQRTIPIYALIATENLKLKAGDDTAIKAESAAKPVADVKPAAAMTLKVPVGRTGLRDSMYVDRDADSVVVHFDTELGRTRRRDKFETTVRVTLPMLYGALADSMLAALPEGTITGGRDLVSEVAVRGVRLPVPEGGTLELWPVTRPGRDGPLVVGYRARVTR